MLITNPLFQADGTDVPRDQVPDLKVSVVSAEVTLPTAMDELPVWSDDYTVHVDITDGRPGGHGTDDDV